jgi:hypothetical protein
MADLRKVKATIKEIAGRRANVTIEEIEWVVAQLKENGCKTDSRAAGGHQVIFTVDKEIFGVCTHHKGGRQLKRCYVNAFMDAMIKLGFYEDN